MAAKNWLTKEARPTYVCDRSVLPHSGEGSAFYVGDFTVLAALLPLMPRRRIGGGVWRLGAGAGMKEGKDLWCSQRHSLWIKDTVQMSGI